MNKLFALLVLVASVAFAVSPFLSSGFNGFTADQFPIPQDNPPVQPAGYAFSIWGLIYLWLIAGAVFGLMRRADDPDWEQQRPPLLASLVIGAAWIPVANISPVWATVMIWAMLGTALLSLFRAGDTDRWWQLSPVAVYAGWLTAASSVSVGLLLGGYGYLNGTLSALVALGIALAIAMVVQYRLHRAPLYGVTVIWALIGVIVANWQPFNVAVAGLAGIGIFAILALRGTDTE
jgi:MFS family permease